MFCSECGTRLEMVPTPQPLVSPPTQLRLDPYPVAPRPSPSRLPAVVTALLLVGLGWLLPRGAEKPVGGATPLAVSVSAGSPSPRGDAGAGDAVSSPPAPVPASPSSVAAPVPPRPADSSTVRPAPPPRRLSGHAHASDFEPPYEADLVLDGNPATYWHAGHHGGYGWIEITLERPALIRRVGLMPGRIDAGPEMFRANDRVRYVRVELPDGVTVKGELRDEPRMQYLAVEPPVRASHLRLVFTGIYRGTSWFHTIVPEVEVWGVPGGG